MKTYTVCSENVRSMDISADSERDAALVFLKQCPDVTSGKISVKEIGGSIFSTAIDYSAENLRSILGYPDSQSLTVKGKLLETHIKALRENEADVIIKAIIALREELDPSAIEPLVTVLPHPLVQVRHMAAGALIKFGAAAVDSLIKTLNHNDWTAREAASVALGEIVDSRAVEPLIGVLNDKEMEVRGTAARALGKIKDRAAVVPLIQALKDYQWNVRECAAYALGEIGDPSAADALKRALGDSVDPVVWAARSALKRMSLWAGN